MKTDEVRSRFLEFFKNKGHTVCPSDSLVPENDPSLLFTGAGMNRFKDYFLGKVKNPKFTRAASSQKCLRTVDIEKVGRTIAHHTFFEMLGNFSFGDYFKREAITWAWEFLTEELKLPKDRFSVSVYEEDELAYKIWSGPMKVPKERIFKFGAADNYWPANAPTEGPNGPCGPCSEIFYDQGEEYGCGSPDCKVGCDCQRYTEIWNLVFTQYDRQENGDLLDLPKPNIDTGMGLERLAAVMQKVPSNFEIDIFKPIIKTISDKIKVPYEAHKEEGARIRRIADHVRCVTFMMADGVFPSNEGRGYVERRVLRRAVRDAITLGMDKPFLYKLVPTVVDVMKQPYPELVAKRESIARLIKTEEEKFLETVEQGMNLLEEMITDLKVTPNKVFPGKEAFKLYDTYGFPIDLTESILHEKGLKIDMRGYEEAMAEQKTRARAMSKLTAEIFAHTPIDDVKQILTETKFVGYETTQAEVKIEAILMDGKLVTEAPAKSKVTIITEQTPFYAESGGQVGDTGRFKGAELDVKIKDTQKTQDYVLHIGEVKKGTLTTGLTLEAVVDEKRRQAIARNHTTTHLLQHALRNVLGQHVEQAGSFVAHDHFRFDFSHFSAISPEELKVIEEKINQHIMDNNPVATRILALTDARKQGVLAFIAEEYENQVRMVEIGNYSKELCAGTHVLSTGEIGYFKLLSESSVASGMRRIEAVTGTTAVKTALKEKDTLRELGQLVGTTPEQLTGKIKTFLKELKSAQAEITRYDQKANLEIARALMGKGQVISGTRVITEPMDDCNIKDLRTIADELRKSPEPIIALLAVRSDKKVNLVLTLSPSLIKDDFDAVKLLKETAAIIGGSGGGRKELAQAGGKNPDKLDEAFKFFIDLVSKKLGGGM